MTDKIKALIDGVRTDYGPYKKFPYTFVEYPNVDRLIEAAPLLAEALEVAVKVLEELAAPFVLNDAPDQQVRYLPAKEVLTRIAKIVDRVKPGAEI